MSTKQTILWRLHDRVKSIGAIRRFFISIFFPEFAKMLGDLAELGGIVDNEASK
jgi:hypothetical protein